MSMETVNTLAQVISQVGFPIVMCGVLMWWMMKQQERQDRRDEQQDERNQSLMESLNNLSIVISELKQKINDWMGQK